MSDTSTISPEELIKHLDETAFYIAGRGLLVLVRSHYFWMARFTAATLEQRPNTRVSVSVAPTVPGLRRVRVRFTALPYGVRFSALVLAALQVSDSLFQFVSRLPYHLLLSAARGIQKFAVLNLNAVPALVAAIVIVFLSGDTWRILGQGFDIPFVILLCVFLLVGLLAVGDVRHVRNNVVVGVSEGGELATAQTEAPPLTQALNSLASGAELRLGRIDMINVWLIYVGMLLGNLVVITGLVASGLIVVGVIRIDQATTHKLLNAPPHVLWNLPVAHMVVTRQLLTMSLSLGGLATLSYVVAGLQDAEARSRFRLTATEGLRRVLSAYVIYRAARDAASDLTGITLH